MIFIMNEQGGSRLNIRKFSLSQRDINEWNDLDDKTVNIMLINLFKTKIRKSFEECL